MSVPDSEADIYKIGNGEPLTKEEVIAVQSVFAGEANPGQQVLAMSVIIDKIAMVDHMTFLEDRHDASVFLAGRAFVGKYTRSITQRKVGEMTQ
jgi:hypothetical protein